MSPLLLGLTASDQLEELQQRVYLIRRGLGARRGSLASGSRQEQAPFTPLSWEELAPLTPLS